MEDAELSFIQGINEKCEEAFHELFKRFRNYLVVFALRRVRLLDEAEDIVQEVFISVWESGKKWNSYAGFKAFLYESVQNRCLYRPLRRLRPRPTDNNRFRYARGSLCRQSCFSAKTRLF